MVGRDERHAALALYGGKNLPHAGIHRLGGRAGRLHDAGMPHHVAVREVHDVHVGLVGVDGRRQGVGHLGLAHLRLQIIGGHLRARDEPSALPRLLGLATAVQEESDMGVLLRLGDMVLGKPRVGEHVGQHVFRELLGEGHRRRDLRIVLREAHEMHARPRLARKTGEVGVGEGAGDLAGAVGAEVEEHDRVPVAHAAGI